jgi:post-segregation antitoxin (ccd killing protein)
MNMANKNVNSEHKKLTKSDKEYIKGLVQNLALQRLTDQEITEHLQSKGMDIARSTVCTIRNKIEKESEKWYVELRESRCKYLATYKERLDSLMSYQRKLNKIVEICTTNNIYHDTVIKAISELHKIELSIFNIWKQLPVIPSYSEVKVPQLEELKQKLQQQFERQLQEAKEGICKAVSRIGFFNSNGDNDD